MCQTRDHELHKLLCVTYLKHGSWITANSGGMRRIVATPKDAKPQSRVYHTWAEFDRMSVDQRRKRIFDCCFFNGEWVSGEFDGAEIIKLVATLQDAPLFRFLIQTRLHLQQPTLALTAWTKYCNWNPLIIQEIIDCPTIDF
jgi:hypothetical protein